MILGIGCDICDIRRIESLIKTQGVKFLKRVFTTSEQERLQKRAESTAGFAKVFAAKESVVKWFHNASNGTMAITQNLKQLLEKQGLEHLFLCPMGVDTDAFVRNEDSKIKDRKLFSQNLVLFQY
jgi:phosphopantetheine--protein transferase-like protein